MPVNILNLSYLLSTENTTGYLPNHQGECYLECKYFLFMLSLSQISLFGAFCLFCIMRRYISLAVFSDWLKYPFIQVIFSAMFVAISPTILSRLEFQLKFVNQLRFFNRIWIRLGRNFNVISPRFPNNYENDKACIAALIQNLSARFITFHGELNEVAFKLRSAGCTSATNITLLITCIQNFSMLIGWAQVN